LPEQLVIINAIISTIDLVIWLEYHEIVYSSVGNQSEGLAKAAETDLTLRPPCTHSFG
jgi:hypothetical protein